MTPAPTDQPQNPGAERAGVMRLFASCSCFPASNFQPLALALSRFLISNFQPLTPKIYPSIVSSRNRANRPGISDLIFSTRQNSEAFPEANANAKRKVTQPTPTATEIETAAAHIANRLRRDYDVPAQPRIAARPAERNCRDFPRERNASATGNFSLNFDLNLFRFA
jgi:hypothetical protein